MTEEEIVQDYGKRLREALVLVRKRFRGRLILRSCHSGTQDKRAKTHDQFEALRRMNPNPNPITLTLTLTLTLYNPNPNPTTLTKALRRMNAMLLKVARELCVEVFTLALALA